MTHQARGGKGWGASAEVRDLPDQEGGLAREERGARGVGVLRHDAGDLRRRAPDKWESVQGVRAGAG